MENDSIHNENNLIPRYNVLKFNFSDDEKLILEELRENLIDLAISEKMSSFNEELILKDIIRFLENRLQNRFDYEYKENLARNM
ncbi:MAG: CpaF family protein, partial [Methanobrevibacter sp.]|nr:CpaF family protein [Methanobrevibacter sp.]